MFHDKGLDAAFPALVNITSRELTISWGDPENTGVSHYIVYTTTKGGTKGTEHQVERSLVYLVNTWCGFVQCRLCNINHMNKQNAV